MAIAAIATNNPAAEPTSAPSAGEAAPESSVKLKVNSKIARLILPDGRSFQDLTIIAIDEHQLRFIHREGVATIPLALAIQALPNVEEFQFGAPRSETVESPEVRRVRESAQYQRLTGLDAMQVNRALDYRDWCLAHPNGGTRTDGTGRQVQISATESRRLYGIAMNILNNRPPTNPNPAGSLSLEDVLSIVPNNQPTTSPDSRPSGEPSYTLPLPTPSIRVYPSSGRRSAIQTRIDGDFDGFDHGKLYRMTNGQIWEQVEFKYFYRYAFMPDVLIYNTSGRWMMQVDGMGDPVQVEQLR